VVTAAVDVPERNLGAVVDPDTRQRYADTATRTAADHDPDDVV
jgi:hypothetical protein